LDVVDVASPACTGIFTGFYARLVVMVVVVASAVGLLYAYPYLRRRWSGTALTPTEMAHLKSQSLRDVFIVLLMVHTMVSGKAFAFFRCHTVEDTSFLMADYRLTCYDATWIGMSVFAGAVIVGFSLGVPCAIAYTLHARRHHLHDPQTARLLGILYSLYTPEAYYYEAINMSSSCAGVDARVLRPASEMQLACALV